MRDFCSVGSKLTYRVIFDGGFLVLLYWNSERWIEIDTAGAMYTTLDEFVAQELETGL